MTSKNLVRMSARIEPRLMAAVKAAAAMCEMTVEEFVAMVLGHDDDVSTMYEQYDQPITCAEKQK